MVFISVEVFGLKVDAQGWKPVTEDDVARLMMQSAEIKLVNTVNGFLYYRGMRGDEIVEACWLKLLPADGLKKHSDYHQDDEQLAFLQHQTERKLAA